MTRVRSRKAGAAWLALAVFIATGAGCDGGPAATDAGSDTGTPPRTDGGTPDGTMPPRDLGTDTGPVAIDMGPGDMGTDTGPAPGDMGPGDAGLPTGAPTTFAMVVNTGFTSPSDAVSSPDGVTFYFAAYDSAQLPTIFTVPAAGGAATARFSGAPLEAPTGLVLSCDGTTLYIADSGASAVFSLTVSGATAPTALTITGFDDPNALGLADCNTLVSSGRDMTGQAAVVRAPIAGGAATVAAAGGALRAPTGLHVDAAGTIWALDHLAFGTNGQGVLFKIPTGMPAVEVVSGLNLGTPGGVSLTAGGGNAVVGSRNAVGASVLTVVNTTTNAATTTALPAAFLDPAGLRTARAAGVFAIVDSEGSAIYRGQ